MCVCGQWVYSMVAARYATRYSTQLPLSMWVSGHPLEASNDSMGDDYHVWNVELLMETHSGVLFSIEKMGPPCRTRAVKHDTTVEWKVSRRAARYSDNYNFFSLTGRPCEKFFHTQRAVSSCKSRSLKKTI